MIRNFLIITSLSGGSFAAAALTVDFEELPAPAPDYFTNTGFVSQGVDFTGAPFAGWVYSDAADTTTPGFGNQYAAIPGAGSGGSGNYAVGFGNGSFINLPTGQTPASVELTNTTYAFLAVRDGDDGNPNPFVKGPFGGTTGDDPDFFTVTLTGYAGSDGTGGVTGTPVEFALADYRFADNSQDFVIDDWTLVDLSALGDAGSIGLTFASSDVGGFGINTPVYVALDNLTLVPEPGTLAVLTVLGLVATRRRNA